MNARFQCLMTSLMSDILTSIQGIISIEIKLGEIEIVWIRDHLLLSFCIF
jgi:hypothetical protein